MSSRDSNYLGQLGINGLGYKLKKAVNWMKSYSKDNLKALVILAVGVGLVSGGFVYSKQNTNAAGDISGVVYRDFNYDNVMNNTDVGQGGVTVTAFDSSNASVGTATTAFDGTYTLSATGTGPYRLEFSNLPANNFVTMGGSLTSVVADGNSSGNNVGIVNPGEYCQSDPDLGLSCYVSAVEDDDNGPTLITYGYNDSGQGHPNAVPHSMADETGSINGLAYHRKSGSLFNAAYHKRQTTFGPGGPGAIYLATSANDDPVVNTTLFATVPNAGPDTHDLTDLFHDSSAYTSVSKNSLGDIDIAEDQKSLYVVNLNDRQIYNIELNYSGTGLPTAGAIASIPIPLDLPNSGGAALPLGAGSNEHQGCATDDVRPSALEIRDGKVYVGLVCSAESTQLTSDLRAYVYAYDIASATFETSPIFEMPLGYGRGCITGTDGSAECDRGGPSRNDGGKVHNGAWNPWTDDYNATISTTTDPVGNTNNTRDNSSYPMPLLTDIEFDGNSIVLAFRDRLADMLGLGGRPFDPPGERTKLSGAVSGGDILRACADGSGKYIAENNGTCGGVTTAGANNEKGPGGGEYYFNESFAVNVNQPDEGGHLETALGSLAQVAQNFSNELTVLDPIDLVSAGTERYNSITADVENEYEAYQELVTSQNTFIKANGLGDLEVLCEEAPMFIGNFVWMDTDGDGIQDPDEMVIGGVTVNLYDGTGNLIATKVTDANGYYGFSTTDGVLPETSYVIRVDNPADYAAGGPLEGKLPTLSNVGDSDVHDNDGVVAADNYPEILYTTEINGFNNDTLDFGFVETASVGDYVWVDTDRDGVQDPTEEPIPNVTVNLYQAGPDGLFHTADDVLVATQITDANGLYLFDNLMPGEYCIVVDSSTLPDGYSQTFDAEGALDHKSTKTLAPGEHDRLQDFGYVRPTPLSKTGSGLTSAILVVLAAGLATTLTIGVEATRKRRLRY